MSRSVISDLLNIFKASYNVVLPDKIIKQSVSYDSTSNILKITDKKYDLTNKNVYVVGAGKAVQYMAREIDIILGTKIKKGIISIPTKSLIPNIMSTNIVYYEGAQDNLPDVCAEKTAKKIKKLASSLTKDDFLLTLLSGGGSALLPLPKEPITLNKKLELIKNLANSGADIKELNTVRKKISDIKGGKLALAARPAYNVTLILSDVVDDPLDIIASGPTVEDKDEVGKATNILKKYKLYEDLPNSVKEVLRETTSSQECLGEIPTFLLGSNKNSLSEAVNEAKQYNYIPIFLSRGVTGNVKFLAMEYVKLAKIFAEYIQGKVDRDLLIKKSNNLSIPGINTGSLESIDMRKDKDFCLILGGEPTVEVKGVGKGGRNQQLALEFSMFIHEDKADFEGCDVYFLSAGTDGIDGPTDAAGAIGYLNLISDSEQANINVHNFLKNNDTYNFYKSFKNGMMHVITGHTNTNVMDIHLMIIKKYE